MSDKKYLKIAQHYEKCFLDHGDSHLGVDWPKKAEVDVRYDVMLNVIRPYKEDITFLDFGCGTAQLYQYIQDQNIKGIIYSGLDISEKFINASQLKFPKIDFYCMDVLKNENKLPVFDYVVMNGVFTQKLGLTHEEMFAYLKELILCVFRHAKSGIAFNVMSKHVDWEQSGNFHLGYDELAYFLSKQVSRNFIIRNDYRLYEYTTYIYR